jgi:hypothetical protein
MKLAKKMKSLFRKTEGLAGAQLRVQLVPAVPVSEQQRGWIPPPHAREEFIMDL